MLVAVASEDRVTSKAGGLVASGYSDQGGRNGGTLFLGTILHKYCWQRRIRGIKEVLRKKREIKIKANGNGENIFFLQATDK